MKEAEIIDDKKGVHTFVKCTPFIGQTIYESLIS